MKVVFCMCLVVLVETAPTVVENVKQQQEYNQPRPYNQPLDYNQLQDYNQPQIHNQLLDYNQPQPHSPLDYNQLLRAFNTPLDYNHPPVYSQPQAYNQPLDYTHPQAYNQPLDYSQLRAYSAPADQRLDYPRGRRSNQFAVVSPCSAAASSMAYSPYYSHGYGSPYTYPYAHPGRVYRADEDVEAMSFSDADQVENTARSYGYEAPAGLAYGVFPNAHTGGCGMPLLVSCSPNVVQGRLVKAEPHSFSTPVNYRLTEHPEANAQDHHTTDHDAKTR